MTSAIDKAYDAIKTKIMSGEYAPGHQLKEVQLASELGVSRTPTKHAITRLVEEGLATTHSNRRSFVAELTAEQFSQIFDVLMMLEGYSAGQAAKKISDADIKTLKALNKEMATCNVNLSAEHARFMEINTEFHNIIHQASGNKPIASNILKLIELTRFLLVKHGELNRTQVRNAITEHKDIIAALASGNAEMASLQMQLHRAAIRSSFEALWVELERSDQREVLTLAGGTAA